MEGVHLERARAPLFYFPPQSLPHVIPAPMRDITLLHPFNIPEDTYRRVMDVNLPITIATVYATTVWWLNRVNKRRNYKPWQFSRSKAFLWFVVAHNVALAIFSAWVAVGMFRAISIVLPPRGSPAGVAVTADALCKMHGPRGYGNAVFFDPDMTEWKTLSRSVQLFQGTPDPTDLGRLWNEGLAYYGWIFYLSKFYEVVDTIIILAKGKKSSLLQTYHHTGAMIGMWAGMRYMSAPIWCFVQVNSFIHTIMYSYYAACALGVRAPMLFKRTLTTMQIIQLVFGASYALMHLILAFDIPVETPYIVLHEKSAAMTGVVSSVLAAPTGPYVAMLLKKLALRAAGGEGLAKNVGQTHPSLLSQPAAVTELSPPVEQDIKYSWKRARVHCVDTSGEVLAILLNVSYLIPLIYLFARFFIRSYLRRAERPKMAQIASTAARLRASSTDAVKRVQREIREAIIAEQGSYSDLESSKTPTPSILSTITTPSSGSAPRSGAGTPPTMPPFTAAPDTAESVWFGTENGGRHMDKELDSIATPSDSAGRNPTGPQDSVEISSQGAQDEPRAHDAGLPAGPEPERDTNTRHKGDETFVSQTNGFANIPESHEGKGQSQASSRIPRSKKSLGNAKTGETPREAQGKVSIHAKDPNGVHNSEPVEENAQNNERDTRDETNEQRESVKPETSEISDTDTSNVDHGDADPAADATAAVDKANSEPADIDTEDGDPEDIDTAHVVPAEIGMADAGPTYADTANADTANADTADADIADAETADTDSRQDNTADANSAKDDTVDVNTVHVDSAEFDTTNADPLDVHTADAEPADADIADTGPTNVDTANAGPIDDVTVDVNTVDADTTNAEEAAADESDLKTGDAVRVDADGVNVDEMDSSQANAERENTDETNGEALNAEEDDAEESEAELEGSAEDLTISSLTAPRASSSPSPSESRRKAEEAVRRAYEAADIATQKASEDDAESIISIETTHTVDSITNESLTEARRYEIPGVDEALDHDEKEAERELQPDHNDVDRPQEAQP